MIGASKIEKPQYRELDQVKDEIRQLLEKDKTMKKLEEEVARLRNQYRIEVNEEFLRVCWIMRKQCKQGLKQINNQSIKRCKNRQEAAKEQQVKRRLL